MKKTPLKKTSFSVIFSRFVYYIIISEDDFEKKFFLVIEGLAKIRAGSFIFGG